MSVLHSLLGGTRVQALPGHPDVGVHESAAVLQRPIPVEPTERGAQAVHKHVGGGEEEVDAVGVVGESLTVADVRGDNCKEGKQEGRERGWKGKGGE